MKTPTSDTRPPQDAPAPVPAPAPAHRHWHAGIAVIVAIVVFLLGAAAVLTPFVVRRTVCKNLTQDQKRELADWLQRPRKIPPEWREAKPFSAELVSAYDSQYQYWMTHSASLSRFEYTTTTLETARGSSVPLSQSFLTSATEAIRTSQPWLERLEQMASQPDYTAELFFPAPGISRDSEDFLQLRDGGRHLHFRTDYLLYKRDYDRALSDTLTLLRLGKRHPASPLIIHLISSYVQHLALESMAVIANESTDTALVRRALDELNRMEPSFVNYSTSDEHFVSLVGAMRAMEREGYPVDFSPEKPCLYWSMQVIEGNIKFPRWKLSTLPANDPHREPLTRYLDELARPLAPDVQDVTRMWQRKWFRMLCTVTPELIYQPMGNGGLRISTVMTARKARYDLTRLLIAGRLIEKEGKATSSTLANYTPAYLPQMPTDPFAGKPYLWSNEIGRFYSIGPDHSDDKCKHAYDINHSGSSGDIWIP